MIIYIYIISIYTISTYISYMCNVYAISSCAYISWHLNPTMYRAYIYICVHNYIYIYTCLSISLPLYIYIHMYYIYICMYLSPSLSLDTSDNHICWLLGLANGDFEAGGTTSDVQQDWSWFDPLSVMDSISDSMGNTEIATWIMICLLCD